MDLKKPVIIFSSLISFACSGGNHDADLKNFRYNAKLILKEDKSFIENLYDIVSESEIRASIEKLRIFSMHNKPVSSMHALNDRVSKDIETIHKNLHAEGFYNSNVESNIKISATNEVTVTIKVSPNNKFKLKTKLKLLDQNDDTNKNYSNLLNQFYMLLQLVHHL